MNKEIQSVDGLYNFFFGSAWTLLLVVLNNANNWNTNLGLFSAKGLYGYLFIHLDAKGPFDFLCVKN